MRWKIDRGATSQPSASATISAKCTAWALTTGSVPGWPRQIGQVLVLGGSPNDSSQPQNIFVRVGELDVDLQSDDRLVLAVAELLGHRRHGASGGSQPIACSSA